MGSQAFTTPGSITFTPGTGVTSIDVILIGGGGGGESAGGGGGGGGGESRVVTGLGCTPGVGITGFVGAGGGGSTNGAATLFATFAAQGGLRGGGVSTGTGGLGGTGGTGGTGYNGGNGGNWSGGIGGGGGGASTSGGAGGNGGTPTAGVGSSPGGNGGAAGDPPANGSSYGGGGGGSEGMTSGGSGADGYVLVTWVDPIICGPVGTASNSTYITSDDAYVWNYTTVAASDPFLTLDVHLFGNATVTGLTFNGDALTLIGVRSAAGNTHRVECWGLVNPDIGTYVVSVTLSAAVDSVTCGAQYENVNQSYPTESFASATATNSGSADDAEATVSSPTDSCVIHAATVTDDGSITAGQTSRNNVTGAGGSAVQSDTDTVVSPAASTLMNFTGLGTTATWVVGAYAIRPTGSGSGFKPWFLKCNSYIGPGWVV